MSTVCEGKPVTGPCSPLIGAALGIVYIVGAAASPCVTAHFLLNAFSEPGLGDVVILRLRNMTALDATGIHALEQFSKRLHKRGKTLLVCGARDQPSQLISRSDFLNHVGAENVLPHIQAALDRANEIQGDFEGIGRELALEMEHRPL